MENKKNNKVIIVSLSVIIVILATLCILFATGTIVLKSKEINNNDDGNIKNEQNLIETIKITNFTFEKPYAGGIGGTDINTILIDMNANLNCSDDSVIGITFSGYCLDAKDNKYIVDGPIQVMAFYCDNDFSHSDSGTLMVGRVFDSNGIEIDTSRIKWEEIEMTYCKIDKATLVGRDGELLPSLTKELNYEKNF